MIFDTPKAKQCAHYNSKYLPLTENWIYRTIINHCHYSPIVLSRKKTNSTLFQISSLFSLSDFNPIRQYSEILFFKIFGYFHFFKQMCCGHNVEILHAHFGYHGVKMLGLKRKLQIPMIVSFYGDDVFAFTQHKRNRKKYVRLFKEVDKALVLGPYMKAELIKLGCPEHKIIIHHLGIDVDKIEFSKRVIKPDHAIRFLIASSFVAKKGIDLAIQTLSKFKNDYNFTLDIIGDGALKNEILNVIDASGIKDRITLHGYKPYDYFINMAHQCDVFIQASRTTSKNGKEGTPMAIVDAMATGMAIISTKHSDIPEIVTDGEHGYLAEENDLTSLQSCMEKMFIHRNQIPTFGANGRARIEREFNSKVQTLKLEDYYDDLVKK